MVDFHFKVIDNSYMASTHKEGQTLESFKNMAALYDKNTKVARIDFRECEVIDVHNINTANDKITYTEMNVSEEPLETIANGKYRIFGREVISSVLHPSQLQKDGYNLREIEANQIAFISRAQMQDHYYFISDTAWNSFFKVMPYKRTRSTRPDSPRLLSAYAFSLACELDEAYNNGLSNDNTEEKDLGNGIAYCVYRTSQSDKTMHTIAGFYSRKSTRIPFTSISSTIQELEAEYGPACLAENWTIQNGVATVIVIFKKEVEEIKKQYPYLDMIPCHAFTTSDTGYVKAKVRTGWITQNNVFFSNDNNVSALSGDSTEQDLIAAWKTVFYKSVEAHHHNLINLCLHNSYYVAKNRSDFKSVVEKIMANGKVKKYGVNKLSVIVVNYIVDTYYEDGLMFSEQQIKFYIRDTISMIANKTDNAILKAKTDNINTKSWIRVRDSVMGAVMFSSNTNN